MSDDIEAVLEFLRQLAVTGDKRTTRTRYDRERPADYLSSTGLAKRGYPWNRVIELAGLPANYRPSRPNWTAGAEEDAAIMAADREISHWRREGLPVLASTARTVIRRVLLPGGVIGQLTEEIVSVR